MVDYGESNKCVNCGGDGLDGDEFCIPCSGSGYVSTLGAGVYRKALKEKVTDMETGLANVLTKLDTIDTQLDALDTKLDVIETKIDALET